MDHADFFRSEKHKLTENSVKGSLSKNFSFWKNLGTYDYILDIVKNGYSIPFTKLPPTMKIRNNLSAMKNKSFVQEKVNELLSSGRVVKVPFQPFVVSPLSVAENRTKKRLILDLSVLNNFVRKEKIRFEDHKVASQYFTKDCYCIKFDLCSGYHHIDIAAEFQTYLGFQWEGDYFCFTVLPFGLSSAPFIFTKCLRPMVKLWRENGLKIVLYLDDGLLMAPSYDTCNLASTFVRDSLSQAGFHINFEKSVFIPTQDIEWLGLRWNSKLFELSIPQRRVDDVKACLLRVIPLLPHISYRQLAQVTGKLISLSPVLGSICRLMTRYCYMTVSSRTSWDKRIINLDPSVLYELHFWLKNVSRFNSKKNERNSTFPFSCIFRCE